MAYTDCDVCGSRIYLIWGDEIKWTGRCDVCGTIVMFVTKEDVIHEYKQYQR